jgi:putative endonuclease
MRRNILSKGYSILERNYRAPHGEIDPISLDKGAVVFVEVKTRTTDVYGAPGLNVDHREQEHMVRAALGYLKHRKLHQMPCRFDVVAIGGADSDRVEVIQNAFEINRTGIERAGLPACLQANGQPAPQTGGSP